MMAQLQERWVLWALCAGYVFYCFLLVFEAADDIAMVAVFSLDESVAAQNVRKLFKEGITTQPSFTYGALFYYVPVLLLYVLSVFVTVTEHMMIVVLRGVDVLAGVGCLWMVYRIGERFFDRPTGLMAVALLLPLLVFLRWSVEIHPDLPQAFWMLCCVYMCCGLVDRFKVSDVWLSAGFAGLAFGTKYGGVFLLPLIVFAIVWAAKKEHGWLGFMQKPFLVGLMGMPVVFGLTFILTNPYAVLDPVGLHAQVLSEKAIMTFGHTIQTDRSGLAWIQMIPDAIGWLNVLAAILILGFLLQRKLQDISDAHIVLAAWFVILMVYLMVEVRVFYPRHLLPIIPVLLLAAASLYKQAGLWCAQRVGKGQVIVWGLLVVLAGVGSGQNAWAFFESKRGRAQRSVEIEAGRWVGETFSKETSILYDSYAYVPSKFQYSFVVAPAHTFAVVNHFEPDIIMLREARFKRFMDLTQADRSRVGKHAFYDIHYFYRFIEEGVLTDYRLRKKFGGVAIYERAGKRNHDISFLECKQLFASKRLVNVGRAREVMGDQHFLKSNWALAVRDYTLGVQVAPDYTTLRYKLGRAFIAAGDSVRGEMAFQKVIDQIGDISQVEWANIYLDIAQSYFVGKFYDQARIKITQALEHNEDLAAAHFDLGACLLALGQVEQADLTYQNAVSLFGADTSAVIKLRVLAKEEKYRENAQRFMARHFDIIEPE